MMVSIIAAHSYIALLLAVTASSSFGQFSSAGDGSLHAVASTSRVNITHEQNPSVVNGDHHTSRFHSPLSGSFRTNDHVNTWTDKTLEPSLSHLLSKSVGRRSPQSPLRLSSISVSELPSPTILTHSFKRSRGDWSPSHSHLNGQSQARWLSSHFKSNKYPNSQLDLTQSAFKTVAAASRSFGIRTHSTLSLQPSLSLRYLSSSILQTPPLSSVPSSQFMNISPTPRQNSSVVESVGKPLTSKKPDRNTDKISGSFISVLQASKSKPDTSVAGLPENSLDSLLSYHSSTSVLSPNKLPQSYSLSSSEISSTINSLLSVMATSKHRQSYHSLNSVELAVSSLKSFTLSKTLPQNMTNFPPTQSTFIESDLNTDVPSHSFMFSSSSSYMTKFTSQKREISSPKSSLTLSVASLASDTLFTPQMKTYPPTRTLKTISAHTMGMKISPSDISYFSHVSSSSHDEIIQSASGSSVLTKTENNIPAASVDTKSISLRSVSSWSTFAVTHDADLSSLNHVPSSPVQTPLLPFSSPNTLWNTMFSSSVASKSSLPLFPDLHSSTSKIQPSIEATPVPSFSDMLNTPSPHMINTLSLHSTLTPGKVSPVLFSTYYLQSGLITPSPSFSVTKTHLAKDPMNSSTISPSYSPDIDQSHISSSSLSDMQTSSSIHPFHTNSLSEHPVNPTDPVSFKSSSFSLSMSSHISTNSPSIEQTLFPQIISSSRVLTFSQTLSASVSNELPFTLSSHLLQNVSLSRKTSTLSSINFTKSSQISHLSPQKSRSKLSSSGMKQFSESGIPNFSTSIKLSTFQKQTPLSPSVPITLHPSLTFKPHSVAPVEVATSSLKTVPLFRTGPIHSTVSSSGHSSLKLQTISSEQFSLSNSTFASPQSSQFSADETLSSLHPLSSSLRLLSPSPSVSEMPNSLPFPTKTESVTPISHTSISSYSNISPTTVKIALSFSSMHSRAISFHQSSSSPMISTASVFTSSHQSHLSKPLLSSNSSLIQTPTNLPQTPTSSFAQFTSLSLNTPSFTFYSSHTYSQNSLATSRKTISSNPPSVSSINFASSRVLPVSETTRFSDTSVFTTQTYWKLQSTPLQFSPPLTSVALSAAFSDELPRTFSQFPLYSTTLWTQVHSVNTTPNFLPTVIHKTVPTLLPSYTSNFVKSGTVSLTQEGTINRSSTLMRGSGSYISKTVSGSLISKVSREFSVSMTDSKPFLSLASTGSSIEQSYSPTTPGGSSTAPNGSFSLQSRSSLFGFGTSVAGSESITFRNPTTSYSSSSINSRGSSLFYGRSLSKGIRSSAIHSGSSNFKSGSSTSGLKSSVLQSTSSRIDDGFSLPSIIGDGSSIAPMKDSLLYSSLSRFSRGLSTGDSGLPIIPSQSIFYSESSIVTSKSSRLKSSLKSYIPLTPTPSTNNVLQTSHLTKDFSSKHDHFSPMRSQTYSSSVFISSTKVNQPSSFPFPSSSSVIVIPASHSISLSPTDILPSHSEVLPLSFSSFINSTSSIFVKDSTILTNVVLLSTVAPANTTDAFVSMGTESPLITSQTSPSITSSSSSSLPSVSNISSATTFSSLSQNLSTTVIPSRPTLIATSVMATVFPATNSTPPSIPTTLSPSFTLSSSQVHSTPELPSTTVATWSSSFTSEDTVPATSISTPTKPFSPSSHKSSASDFITGRPSNASLITTGEPHLLTSPTPTHPTNPPIANNTGGSTKQGHITTTGITSTIEGAATENLTAEEIFNSNGTTPLASPVTPTLDKSFSTMQYWVMMELVVSMETNIQDSDFLSDLETNLAKSYREARDRELEKENEVKQLLRKLNPEDDIFLRFKRASTVDGSTAQIIDLSRNSEVQTTGELVFYIYSDGANIPALECTTTFTELSLQELTLMMDMVVLSPVTPYNVIPTTPAPSRDTTFIIILCFFILLSCLFCCGICCCCTYCVICGPKRANNERTMSPDTFKMLEFKQKFPYKPYTPNQTPRTNMEYSPSDDEEFLSRSNKRVSIGGVWEESSSTARIIPDETSLSTSFRLPDKLPVTNRGLESSVRISEPPVASYHDHSDLQLQASQSDRDKYLEETATRRLPAPPSSFLTDPNYLAAQMEISKILEPENVPKKKRKKKTISKTAAMETEGNGTAATGSWLQLPNDTQPEPISEARQKVHALIEEAFSLVNFKGTSSTAVTKLPSQDDGEPPKEEVQQSKPIVDSHVMDLLTGRKKEFGMQTVEPHQDSKVVVVPVHTPSSAETSSVLWNPYTARDELQKISPTRESVSLPGDVNSSPPHVAYKFEPKSSQWKEMEKPHYQEETEYASSLLKEPSLDHFEKRHEYAKGNKWPSENFTRSNDPYLALENGYGKHRDNDNGRTLGDTNYLTDFERERKERSTEYFDELDVTGVLGRGRPSRSLLDSIKAELMGTGRRIDDGKEVMEWI